MLDAVTPRPSDPRRGLRRLALVTVGATLLLIAMGGAVRATDSGLACPDWPACFGQWIPPADLNKWLEHSHRLWAGVVGILILWLTVLAAVRHRDDPRLWRVSALALALVFVQSGLGAAVVLLHLRAGLVTSHLVMAWVIVGCLIAIAAMARRPDPEMRDASAPMRVGRWAAAVAVAVLLQSALGSQATGRGAAYVYNAIPFWLADQTWSGHAREWLHLSHRFAGYLVAGVVVWLAVAARREARRAGHGPRWMVTVPMLAAGLVVVQVALGISNVLTQAEVWSAIGHLTVASWLWAVVVTVAALGVARPVVADDQQIRSAAVRSDR